jgi:hypothetical protein
MHRICLLVVLATLHATIASAQGLVALKKETQRFADPTENVSDLIVDIRDNLWKEVLLIPDPADKQQEIAKLLAFSRGDLQSGAGSSASGSTSAVLSPLLPAIFGAAIENGAITRTVSGTTITLKANPAGLVCAAKSEAPEAVVLREREACRTFWNRFGVTASFDTSRGEKKAELEDLKTLDSQFSELAIRFEALNRRDVTLDRVRAEADVFLKKADALVKNQAALATALEGARTRVEKELDNLTDSAAFKGSTGEVRKKMVEEVVRKVVAETKLEPTQAAEARTLWRESLDAYGRLQDKIAGAAVVTVDYALQRPDLAKEELAGGIVPKGARPPDLHTGRVVYAKAPLPNLDLTANLSVSLFGEKRPGMTDYFRDLRLGVEGKFKLRTIEGYGRPTLSFAGLYAFLNQEPLGLGLIAFNEAQIKERGHIGLFQAKFEFPTAKNGMRIPLSLTVSNRTELIKESDVRGQIGLSFNLDSLFAIGK